MRCHSARPVGGLCRVGRSVSGSSQSASLATAIRGVGYDDRFRPGRTPEVGVPAYPGMHRDRGSCSGVDRARRAELRDRQRDLAGLPHRLGEARPLLTEHEGAGGWQGHCLQGLRAGQVVDAKHGQVALVTPGRELLHRLVVPDVLVAVGDHGAATVPPLATDDVHFCREEGVGSSDDGADVEVVLPVLDGNVEVVTAGVEVGHDRLDAPVAVTVCDVALVAVLEQLRVESVVGRPRSWVRPDPDVEPGGLVDPCRWLVAASRRVVAGHGGNSTGGYALGVITELQNAMLLGGLLDPQALIDKFGTYALWGAALVIFIECWLFPFLPGDSLLFLVGLLISQQEQITVPLWLACLVLTVSAILSNIVGYGVGAKVGPRIFSRPDSRFFKQEHVDKTIAFFDKYGNRAIVLARFVPIVRTFITLAAGVGRMPFRRFITYSAIGGIAWATGVTLMGYWLGQVDILADHIDLVLLALVGLSVIPIVIEMLRSRSTKRDERYDEPEERARVLREQAEE